MGRAMERRWKHNFISSCAMKKRKWFWCPVWSCFPGEANQVDSELLIGLELTTMFLLAPQENNPHGRVELRCVQGNSG